MVLLIYLSQNGLDCCTVVGRPYRSQSIVELSEIFNSSNDVDELSLIRNELLFRTTRAARKLLAEVDARLGVESETSTPATILQIELDTIKKRYELLRQTFDVQGEVLSRWGMTSAMPDELQKLVFDYWSDAVTENEDLFGRTTKKLKADQEKLLSERKGLSKKAFEIDTTMGVDDV